MIGYKTIISETKKISGICKLAGDSFLLKDEINNEYYMINLEKKLNYFCNDSDMYKTYIIPKNNNYQFVEKLQIEIDNIDYIVTAEGNSVFIQHPSGVYSVLTFLK